MNTQKGNVILHLVLKHAQSDFDDQELVDAIFLIVGGTMNVTCPKSSPAVLETHVHVRRVKQNVFVWSDLTRLQCEVFLLKFAKLFISVAAEIGVTYEAKLFVPNSIHENEIIVVNKKRCQPPISGLTVEKLGAYSSKNIFCIKQDMSISNKLVKYVWAR